LRIPYFCSVKKSLRFFGLVNISLMLGLVISLCSGYAFHNERFVANQGGFEVENYQGVEATNFLSHTAEAESLVTSAAHAPSSSVKNPFSGFSLIFKCAESLVGAAFFSNDFYFQKLIFRVQHTDLIFPFHYFW